MTRFHLRRRRQSRKRTSAPNLVRALAIRQDRRRHDPRRGRARWRVYGEGRRCGLHRPTVNPDAVYAALGAFQAVVWHLLVTHPALKAKADEWEGSGKAPPPNAWTEGGLLDRDGS